MQERMESTRKNVKIAKLYFYISSIMCLISILIFTFTNLFHIIPIYLIIYFTSVLVFSVCAFCYKAQYNDAREKILELNLKTCLRDGLTKQQTIEYLKNKKIEIKDVKKFEKDLDKYCMKFWCKNSFEIAREHFQNK